MQPYPGQPGYPEQPGEAVPMGMYPHLAQPGYPPSHQGFQPPPGQYPPPDDQGGYPPPGQVYTPQPPYTVPVVSGQPAIGVPIGGPSLAPPMASYIGPPGLEYMAMVDQLIIKQQMEILEAFTGFETANKYKILNSLGQDVFYAKEDTDCCTRQCCGPGRPFEMNILNNQMQEVMHLVRPLRCQACCFPCCLQELEVHSPPGTVIGTVEQEWSIFYPKFVIKDESGEPILRITGPFCGCECCSDVDFILTSVATDQEIGKISKQWSGLGKEVFTDADNFGINFPLDLDVKVKATLLGATFLIDFMYFEKQDQNH